MQNKFLPKNMKKRKHKSGENNFYASISIELQMVITNRLEMIVFVIYLPVIFFHFVNSTKKN